MQPIPRSPWRPVRIGCGLLVLASIVTFVTFVVVGERMARVVRAHTLDPGLCAGEAREILHATRLPDGYRATFAATVPLLGRVVVLEQTASAGLFLFMVRHGSAPADFWVTEPSRLLAVRGLRLEPGPAVSDGSFGAVAYRALRANLHRRPFGARRVLATLLEVNCPESRDALHFGVWIQDDPAPVGFEEDVDLSGTAADEQALREFLAPFDFCGG